MAFSFTWNASFKASPADSETASLGASRIRDLKIALTERLEVDHSMAGDDHDGKHNKTTLRQQAADPTAVAAAGILYTKLSGGLTELFYIDAAGSIVQLVRAGKVNDFPSGTRLPFQQTAAPIGWTKDTTAALNDTAMRIVTGAVGSGGSLAFSTVFSRLASDDHTLTVNEMPSHTHTESGWNSGLVGYAGVGSGNAQTLASGSAGGNAPHSHGMDMRVKYNDFIIASKD